MPNTTGQQKAEIDDEIVTVATYSSIIEADLIRDELAAAGIEAWVADATAAQTLLPMPMVGMMVQVHANDAKMARTVIESSAPDADVVAETQQGVTDDAGSAD